LLLLLGHCWLVLADVACIWSYSFLLINSNYKYVRVTTTASELMDGDLNKIALLNLMHRWRYSHRAAMYQLVSINGIVSVNGFGD
jgi:predicted NAD/FAD-dependent oxidoreductase